MIKFNNPITDVVIQSPKIFKKTVFDFKEVSPFPYYALNHAVESCENKVTFNANTCTILGMSNGETTYLGHFAPEVKSSSFKEQLDYIVKKFKDKTGRLCAIVTGAYDYRAKAPNPSQSLKSFEQMAEVGEILDKNGAVMTMIAGKFDPVYTDNLAVTTDKFILSHNPKIAGRTPLANLHKNVTPKQLEELLSSHYSVVEVDPQHSLMYLC
jgi:hypothetical protein